MLILIRYYDRKRLPRIVSFNTPLICLQRFLLLEALCFQTCNDKCCKIPLTSKLITKYIKHHPSNDLAFRITRGSCSNVIKSCQTTQIYLNIFIQEIKKNTLSFILITAQWAIACLSVFVLLNSAFSWFVDVARRPWFSQSEQSAANCELSSNKKNSKTWLYSRRKIN